VYIKDIFKGQIAKGFGLLNIYPAQLTDSKELKQLIDRLHPIKTDKELIRFGDKGDGGYLVPNDLEGIFTCFSPGVNTISNFERDCAKHGMNVFLADKSVDAPALENEKFSFTKHYIGGWSRHGVLQIDDWVNTSLPDDFKSDLLLQMDIEYSEYEVLLGMSEETLDRLRIMVIEFHDLHLMWNSPVFHYVSLVFNKLLKNHTCVHIHPNNVGTIGAFKKDGITIPRLMEFTFLRNDRISASEPHTLFPHPLDSDNTDDSTLALPECWYK